MALSFLRMSLYLRKLIANYGVAEHVSDSAYFYPPARATFICAKPTLSCLAKTSSIRLKKSMGWTRKGRSRAAIARLDILGSVPLFFPITLRLTTLTLPFTALVRHRRLFRLAVPVKGLGT